MVASILKLAGMAYSEWFSAKRTLPASDLTPFETFLELSTIPEQISAL